MNDIATAFPTKTFVIVGVNVNSLASRPANVQGVLFRPEEAGYLVGYAAGLVGEGAGRPRRRFGGRPEDSAGRQLHRRLSVRRKARRSGNQDVEHVRAELHRPGEMREGCALADRRRLCRRASGRGPLRAGRPARRACEGRVRRRRGHRPGEASPLGDDERRQTRRRRGAVGDPVGEGRNAEDGREQRFRRCAADGVGYGAWSSLVPARIRAAVARQYRKLQAGAITGIPVKVD